MKHQIQINTNMIGNVRISKKKIHLNYKWKRYLNAYLAINTISGCQIFRETPQMMTGTVMSTLKIRTVFWILLLL